MDIAQWLTACLECENPCVQYPVLKKKVISIHLNKVFMHLRK